MNDKLKFVVADQFALIATAAPTDRSAILIEPQPPALPEDVRADLDSLKAKFAPFLSRLTRPLPMRRAHTHKRAKAQISVCRSLGEARTGGTPLPRNI